MALSVFAIKAAEIRDKQYKLSDTDGLYLLVTPKGGKCWRINYRHSGKQRTLSFGVFPDIGLAEARAQRDADRNVLARGEDPAERARIDRLATEAASANTFRAVADAPPMLIWPATSSVAGLIAFSVLACTGGTQEPSM